MKILNFTFLLVAALSILSSCNKKPVDCENQGCSFEKNDNGKAGIVDATERALMNECSENEFTSKSEIENNLIGEWELIGFGDGYNHSRTESQPCANVTIRAEELTFYYSRTCRDTATVHSWELEEVNGAARTFFRLITFPQARGLYMTHFSPKYMYINAIIDDSEMHLYRKVE